MTAGAVAKAAVEACNIFPHIETNTSVLETITLPYNRRVLFLAIDNDSLHDRLSDELSFSALCPDKRSSFQFLLYLTYCCKGQMLQVTLENPDFSTMSPPIREDFAYGRLFCFVLDMDKEEVSGAANPEQPSNVRDGLDNDLFERMMTPFVNRSVNLDVFRSDDAHSDTGSEMQYERVNETKETLKEAYDAFMRLQLVRKRIISLNSAMVAMRDSKKELSSLFDCVDIDSDTLNEGKLDKKQIKEHRGSLFIPLGSGGRQTWFVPEPVANLNLKGFEESIGKITDSKKSDARGKELFESVVTTLSGSRWLNHRVVREGYQRAREKDRAFVRRVRAFAKKLSGSLWTRVRTQGLLVFRYSLERLITLETPQMFVNSMIHKHVPVEHSRIVRVLRELGVRRRTREISHLLKISRCKCPIRREPRGDGTEEDGGEEEEEEDEEEDDTIEDDDYGVCRGDCLTAYACFYNYSQIHPFTASKQGYSHYFAQLYPHLGKLERLSREMKARYAKRKIFESVANMVFLILVNQRFCENSLYESLSEVVDERLLNSSLSLGHQLGDIHLAMCLGSGYREDYRGQEPGDLNPVKVYDHELVRYLFCESLQVGRLFQASTTFNYVITNTAPRYTIERIMLFNVTGPGEGKSYANSVLNYQFARVKGCIETLTSFTPQAFKYKQKRTACVVMIDDAHIAHEKHVKQLDKESHVIPNTFKNLLDTSRLESEVTTADPSTGNLKNARYEAVHNCGFVWNANAMTFVSGAWADRCLIMESEFQKSSNRTRSTKQIQDTVVEQRMDRITAVCLYRQNLVQSATMIADSSVMQFSLRFDKARDACLAALYASYIVCTVAASRRVSLTINQLVFAEAMKLACHFVFDLWIPPWTDIPDGKRYPDLKSYMGRLDKNRRRALDELTFGQICLETNAVYKLCTASCLPDICPRAVDNQAQFVCKVLGYILTQIEAQHLRITLKGGNLCISGIESMFFPESEVKGGNETAHEVIALCPFCKVPVREGNGSRRETYALGSYRQAANQGQACAKRARVNPRKKVGSVTMPLEAVYDLLALHAPSSHSGFWQQLSQALVNAYENKDYEVENPFERGGSRGEGGDGDEDERTDGLRLTFDLDFSDDPVRSLILEATAAIEPLSELEFNKSSLGTETFKCYAPVHYGSVLSKELGAEAPDSVYNEAHQREARHGPQGTFHGPRLSAYSGEYSGVPVKNVSSFCNTRTVYHQDRVFLTVDQNNRGNYRNRVELEEDWEWKDAADVFNQVHGPEAFSVEMLKRDYSATMMVAKGPLPSTRCKDSVSLKNAIKALHHSDGRAALELRRSGTLRSNGHTPGGSTEKQARKRPNAERSKPCPILPGKRSRQSLVA